MTLRIALLGTDNTHGHQFAGFINGWSENVPIPLHSKQRFVPQFYTWAKALREAEHDLRIPVPSPDARVTSIWCPDYDAAALVARACGIERHAANPEEALKDADAVLVLTEEASSHYELAKPALERGLPTFIDKPLTPDAATNQRLADCAAAHKAPWFTGSGLRFSPSLRRFAAELADTVGQPPTALYVQVSGPLEYYGIHALEVANLLAPLSALTEWQGFHSGERGGALLTLGASTTVMIDTLLASRDPPAQAIAFGDRGIARWESNDTPLAILGLVSAFVEMAKTRVAPVKPEESLLMARLALELNEAAAAGARAAISRVRTRS